jgi:hypothetical protein
MCVYTLLNANLMGERARACALESRKTAFRNDFYFYMEGVRLSQIHWVEDEN